MYTQVSDNKLAYENDKEMFDSDHNESTFMASKL